MKIVQSLTERETPLFKVWLYHQQVRVARYTSSQQHSDLCQHSTSVVNVLLSISNQPLHFLPQPAFSMFSFGLPFFFWPTSKSNALLKTWPSSLPSTWPYQRTLFAIANWSMVSFKPSMNIKSIDLFLSLSCTSHIALTMDLSVLHKIPISLSFRHHASLSYCIAGLT